MGERIVIDIDLATQQGVQAMALFVQQLEATRTKTAAVAAEINATDLSLGKMSATTTKTAQQTETLELRMVQLAQDIRFVDTESKNASHGLEQAAAGAKSFSVSGQAAEVAASGLSTGMGALASTVGGVVTSFLGFQAVIRLIDELNQRMERALEMQKQLAQQKLTVQEQLMPLMANLGAFSQQQQDVVMQMVLRSAQAAGATPEQMASALKASHAVGFKVDPSRGNAIAQSLARFAARTNIDDETMERLAKEASLSGVKTEAGSEAFLAKLMAGFVQTPTTSPADYVGYMMRAVESRRAVGESFEFAAGQFSAAIAADPNARRAASLAQTFNVVAQGRDPRAVSAMAQQAVRQGVLRAPSGAEIGRGVAGAMGRLDNEPKVQQAVERLKTLREQETDLDVRQREEQAAFTDEMDRYARQLQTSARTPAGVARRPELESTIKRRTEVHTDRVADFGRTRARQQEEKQRTQALLNRLVAGQITEQQFVALDPETKDRILIATLDAARSNPQAIEELRRSGLLTPDELGAMMRMAAPGAQAAAQRAQAAMAAARPAQSREASREFQGTIVAQARRAAAAEQQRNVAEVGPGESFMSTFMQQSDEYVKRRATDPSSLRYSQDPAYYLNQRNAFTDVTHVPTMTTSGLEAYQRSQYLAQQMRDWWVSLPDDVKAANPGTLTELQRMERDLLQTPLLVARPSSMMMNTLRLYATQFGNIRSGIDAHQRNRGTPTLQATKPATQPTSQPAAPGAPATQPSASALPSHHTYNIDVGMLFTQPGGHLDMPSRGEEFFA